MAAKQKPDATKATRDRVPRLSAQRSQSAPCYSVLQRIWRRKLLSRAGRLCGLGSGSEVGLGVCLRLATRAGHILRGD